MNEPLEPKDLTEVLSAHPSDKLIITSNPDAANASLASIRVGNLFGNTANVLFNSTMFTPANSTTSCTQGQFWFDANYIYFAVANNTIKRIALTSF